MIDVEDEDGKITQEKEIVFKQNNLDFDQELALKNIDIAKEELVYTYRYRGSNDNYRYDLSQEKTSELHDDRSYCLALLGWYLQQYRRKNITNKRVVQQDLSTLSCVSSVSF